MKIYRGTRHGDGSCHVTVDERPLKPRFDLRNHSPDGFEWGYGGSGPAQLALALLADYLEDDLLASQIYQPFKFAVVGALPRDGWQLTGAEIEAEVQRLRGGAQARSSS